MHDALLVRRGQPARDLGGDVDRLRRRKRTRAEQGPQRVASSSSETT
jgi:hypothetical protein